MIGIVKQLFVKILRGMNGDYWNGCLYTFEPQSSKASFDQVQCAPITNFEEIEKSPHSEINALAWKQDGDAWAFGAWVDGQLAGVCWFQARETYRRRGGLFDLSPQEAELAQISTAAAFRRQGVATALIRYGAARMGGKDFQRLYAKIWHGNIASVKAFESAGWHFRMRFFSLRLFGMNKPIIWRLPS